MRQRIKNFGSVSAPIWRKRLSDTVHKQPSYWTLLRICRLN